MASIDKIRVVVRHAIDNAKGMLTVVQKQHEPELARAYAGGLIQGAAEWVKANYDDKDAFELLTRLADEIIAPQLPKGK